MARHDRDWAVHLFPFLWLVYKADFWSDRDRIANLIRSELGLSKSQLTLAQVLEGATWKGGREIAKIKRPVTGGPPIEIESDGTVFWSSGLGLK
jgi:hypothetical protein